jgi:hypothetical protein
VGAAVKQVVGLPCHEKLGGVGHAEDDCARIFERRDQRGRCGLGRSRRAGAFRPRSADRPRRSTFDADRNSMQRTESLSTHDGGFCVASGTPGAVCVPVHVGV